MPNLLIHYGDFTLAAAETDCSASTIRRSEALWPSGGFASWQKPGQLSRSQAYRACSPETELHLNGIGKLVSLLPAVNGGVSGAGVLR